MMSLSLYDLYDLSQQFQRVYKCIWQNRLLIFKYKMGNLCLGPGSTGCCRGPELYGPPPNYVGAPGIIVPIEIGFGSIDGGCCACLIGSVGCCGPDNTTKRYPLAGTGCCGCFSGNVPLYSATYAPSPMIIEQPVIRRAQQEQVIDYVYSQGPPIIQMPIV